jgi:hypothetical protein
MAQTLQELVPQYPLAAPLAVGLLSALGFAVANSMQHLVAGAVPRDVDRAGAVLRHLATRPRWVVATCCSFLAMVLHAWALHLGSITLVQPLMLVGVVLAVPLRAVLERKAPEWAAVKAVGVTVVGLAAFLSFADLQPGRSAPQVTMALPVVVLGAVVAVLLSRCAARTSAPSARAALLGVSAGVLFGLTAGLLKILGVALSRGAGVAPVAVTVASLIVLGLMGTAVNQRAYQIAPIAFSMPLVNVVDIVVALVFGALVFGELPSHSLTGLVLQALALCCAAWGLRGIAALDVVRGCGERALSIAAAP